MGLISTLGELEPEVAEVVEAPPKLSRNPLMARGQSIGCPSCCEGRIEKGPNPEMRTRSVGNMTIYRMDEVRSKRSEIIYRDSGRRG